MRVLLDANVIYTYLSQRSDPYLHDCEAIVKYCKEQKLEGFIALQSLATVWYLMRKVPTELRRNCLRELCKICKLAVTDMTAVRQAIDNVNFPDFEDNLQDCCAKEIHADYIVTANLKDFVGHSQVPAITPAGLLDLLQLQSLLQTPPSPGEVRESPSTYYYTHVVVTRLLPGSPEGHRHFLQTA